MQQASSAEYMQRAAATLADAAETAAANMRAHQDEVTGAGGAEPEPVTASTSASVAGSTPPHPTPSPTAEAATSVQGESRNRWFYPAAGALGVIGLVLVVVFIATTSTGSGDHTYIMTPSATGPESALAAGIYITLVSPVAMPQNVITNAKDVTFVQHAVGPEVCTYTKKIENAKGKYADMNGKTVTLKVNGTNGFIGFLCSAFKKGGGSIFGKSGLGLSNIGQSSAGTTTSSKKGPKLTRASVHALITQGNAWVDAMNAWQSASSRCPLDVRLRSCVGPRYAKWRRLFGRAESYARAAAAITTGLCNKRLLYYLGPGGTGDTLRTDMTFAENHDFTGDRWAYRRLLHELHVAGTASVHAVENARTACLSG
jgi:hypothetical protein